MNNKGITLISLTMYVVGITFVIIAVATLTSFFYNNIVDLRDSTDSLSEFDKFNVAFLKEIKNDEVGIVNIEKTKITFSNGVTFQFQDNGIYRNYVKICEQIKDCQFSSTTMGENIVIKVYLEIGTDFAKTLEYVGNHKQNNETNKRLILTKSTEEYTNGNVIVTLNYINLPEGYEIQYKIGDNQWTAGTSVTVEENNTVVYGRIYNNTTLDEKDNNSIIITNIDKVNPTAPTEIEYNSTINSITVRAIGGTDNLSGVAGYQYSINNINWTETIAENESHIFSELNMLTNYTVYSRTIDNSGRVSDNYVINIHTKGLTAIDIEKDAKNFIGKYVNYGGESTYKGVRWRIFDVENNCIQLIADNYIHVNYLPFAINIRRGKTEYEYMLSDFCVNSSDNRITLINYINTNNNWNEFAIIDGATARGGPTLEQFISSYNKTHDKTNEISKLYFSRTINVMNDALTGYYVGTTENPITTYVRGLDTTEIESLYVINNTNAYAYWLCTASADSIEYVMNISYDGMVGYDNYNGYTRGIRPLISLPQNVSLVEQNDGTFNIIQK